MRFKDKSERDQCFFCLVHILWSFATRSALVPLQSVVIPETVLTSLLLCHYKQRSSGLHTLPSQSYFLAHAYALFHICRAQFKSRWARYTSVTSSFGETSTITVMVARCSLGIRSLVVRPCALTQSNTCPREVDTLFGHSFRPRLPDIAMSSSHAVQGQV